MAGLLVRTVEELKSIGKTRGEATIIIEGELANNLMISGAVRPTENSNGLRGEVVMPTKPDSLMYPVTRILKDLSQASVLEIVEHSGARRIKIYPKPLGRREGN